MLNVELAWQEVLLRVGVAVAIGLGLGWERERHGRAAGLRTTLLVCLASSVAMVLSEYLFREASAGSSGWRPDPARLAAGVLAGMGFLGAGVILRQDKAILGVTTAAVLWLSAILGMACGAGHLALGLLGFALAMLCLLALPRAEAHVQADRYGELEVLADEAGTGPEEIVRSIVGLGMDAVPWVAGIERDLKARTKRMRFEVRIKKDRLASCQLRTVDAVAKLKGVKIVRWS